jgi:toxin YoeB
MAMIIEFSAHAWEEFCFWLDHDADTAQKIRELLKAIQKDPFKGIGKPEQLKFVLQGYWSRRISGEPRLVYRISGSKESDQLCTVIQCRFHYGDK